MREELLVIWSVDPESITQVLRHVELMDKPKLPPWEDTRDTWRAEDGVRVVSTMITLWVDFLLILLACLSLYHSG